MKTIKGNYGECRFCDNMDIEYGLPSLNDNSWEICLTDPPYNIDFKFKYKKKVKKIQYKDKLQFYSNFILWRLSQIRRVSVGTIIFPGNMNTWFYPKFRDILVHYKKNGHSIGSMSYLCTHDVILFYDKFKRKCSTSVFEILLD